MSHSMSMDYKMLLLNAWLSQADIVAYPWIYAVGLVLAKYSVMLVDFLSSWLNC